MLYSEDTLSLQIFTVTLYQPSILAYMTTANLGAKSQPQRQNGVRPTRSITNKCSDIFSTKQQNISRDVHVDNN